MGDTVKLPAEMSTWPRSWLYGLWPLIILTRNRCAVDGSDSTVLHVTVKLDEVKSTVSLLDGDVMATP